MVETRAGAGLKRSGMRIPSAIATMAVVAGCMSVGMTLPQEYVWAMWERCRTERVSRLVELSRVDADGRFWIRSTGGPSEYELADALGCMQTQTRIQPYGEWLRNKPVREVSKEEVVR